MTEIMSGGLMVGSLVLVEEDVFSDYNQLLLKYFTAEGIACKHQTYVAAASSEEASAEKWIRKLPFVAGSPPVSGPQGTSSDPKPSPSQDIEAASSESGDIKIAWQYKKYLGSDSMGAKKSAAWCHSFDMMKNMEASYISQTEISSTSFVSSSGIAQDYYKTVYDTLNRLIHANNESLSRGGPPKITRIALPSMGSIWYSSNSINEQEHKSKILSFLRALRGLLRQSFATCMVTFPAHLYSHDPKFVQRMRHTADSVVQFSAFTGTSTSSSNWFDY
jgi:elongator complex protein 4